MQGTCERHIEVRFYAELNEYLPPHLQFKSLSLQPAKASSVREIIREMRVPLSLVDLVLVNGNSVELAHVPSAGDRISIYPVFETFDISGLTNVNPRPLRVIRFVLDVHLGKLAQYLRMLGFDSFYRTDYRSADLVLLSTNDSRILLSRNKMLVSLPQLMRAHLIRSQHPLGQLRDVFEHFDLYRSCVPLSRCLRCNLLLQPVGKSEVLATLPEKVAQSETEFRRCTQCGRVYWKGSHYVRMRKFVAEFLDSLPGPV